MWGGGTRTHIGTSRMRVREETQNETVLQKNPYKRALRTKTSADIPPIPPPRPRGQKLAKKEPNRSLGTNRSSRSNKKGAKPREGGV